MEFWLRRLSNDPRRMKMTIQGSMSEMKPQQKQPRPRLPAVMRTLAVGDEKAGDAPGCGKDCHSGSNRTK